MPPRKSDPAAGAGGGSGSGQAGNSKRLKSKATTEERAAAAAASAAAAAAAPEQQQHQHGDDRSAQILFLVLESMRAAAREERRLNRLHIERLKAEAPGGAPFTVRREGDTDDDGEGEENGRGALTGRVRLAAFAPRRPLRLSRGPHVSRQPRLPRHVRLRRARLPRLEIHLLPRHGPRERLLGGRPGFWRGGGQGWAWAWAPQPEAEPPYDLVPALAAHRGGVLRVLYVRGEPRGPERVWEVAAALGFRAEQEEQEEEAEEAKGKKKKKRGGKKDDGGEDASAGASAADVLRGIKTLRVDHTFALLDGCQVMELDACFPPRQQPLFNALVSLTLDNYSSSWLLPPPPPASPPSRFAFVDRRPARLFSHRHLPALRELKVALLPDSDCPFEIACEGAGGAQDGVLALTRLQVTSADAEIGETPPLSKGGRWPPGAPLLVSLRSLAALAPTLRSLWASRTWARAVEDGESAQNEYGEDETGSDDQDDGDDGAGGGWPWGAAAAAAAAALGGEQPPRRVKDVCYGGAPASAAPMARLLPGFSQLTGLTSLTFEADYDWRPAGASPGEASAWRAACRAMFLPLGRSLVRLELASSSTSGGCGAKLPSCISRLSLLTSLEVSCFLDSCGPGLRRMSQLRRLLLRVVDDEREGHALLFGRDLEPLTNLRHLFLEQADSCLAPVIEHGLPRLEWLALGDWGAQGVAQAARARAARGPALVYRASRGNVRDDARPMTDDDFAAVIAREGDDWVQQREAFHVREHEQALREADEEERLDLAEAAAAEEAAQAQQQQQQQQQQAGA